MTHRHPSKLGVADSHYYTNTSEPVVGCGAQNGKVDVYNTFFSLRPQTPGSILLGPADLHYYHYTSEPVVAIGATWQGACLKVTCGQS
jgi:hypothetical protein